MASADSPHPRHMNDRACVPGVLALLLVALGGCSPDDRAPGPAVCQVLERVEPLSTAPFPMAVRDIHVSPLSNEDADYFVSFVEGSELNGLPLMAATIDDPFTAWPPDLKDATERSPSALSHVQVRETGRGRSVEPPLLVDGVGLVRPGEAVLQLSAVDDRSFAFFASTLGARTLVGATLRRFDAAGRQSFVYDVTLFDGNARIAEPVAPTCVTMNPRLAVAELPPTAPNPGFLVATSAHAGPSEVCVDAPPRFIALERYRVVSDDVSGLARESVAHIDTGGEVTMFTLASGPDGVWLVFAATEDGERQSLKFVRLDATGAPLEAPRPVSHASSVPVSFFGSTQTRVFATAVIGDDLAVAWGDHDDPSGAINVQLVRHDGELGTSTAFASPGGKALFEDLQLAADPDRRGFIVAWEKSLASGRSAGMARLDCRSAD